MEQSMSDQLRMSYQPSLLNLTDVTGSQALEFGITPLIEPDGGTVTGRSGQDRALASLSPRQAKEMGLLTSGTYGLRGSTLSSSADLASSLASRYRAKTRSLGSTLFTLIWKVRYTPSGRPIFAVRASGLRTSDRDCTSWPTPRSMDGEIAESLETWEVRRDKKAEQKINLHKPLSIVAQMTTWRSPSASDGEGGVMEIRPDTAGKYKLRDEAELANLGAWPSPMAGTPAQNGYNEAGNTDSSRKTVELVAGSDLAGWMTPAVTNIEPTEGRREKRTAYRNSIGRQDCPGGLSEQAVMVTDSWATPTANDHKGSGPTTERKDGKIRNDRLDYQTEQFGPAQLTDSGEMPSGSIAATGNGVLSGQLNPGHSRWLMSLPLIWDVCGIRAADAIRSRRSSKKAKAASQGSEVTATP